MNDQIQMEELLDKALAEAVVKASVRLRIGDHEVTACLQSVDLLDIAQKQRLIRNKHYQAYCEQGLHDKPVNQRDWELTLRMASPDVRERLKNEPPLNLAEQSANHSTMMEMFTELLPEKLRTEKGELLFPVPGNLEKFKTLVKTDMTLFRQLVELYHAVSQKEKRIGDAVKK